MKEKISPLQKALNLWATILIIWSIYRANFKMPEWFDEFIVKPLIFVLPVFYYVKNIEKQEIFPGLWLKLKNLLSDLLFSLIIGGLFFLSAVSANFIKFKQLSFVNNLSLEKGLLMVLIALATGFSEEVLSRGFVLKRLYEDSKNIFSASFFASILFFFLHVPILFTNLKLTGNLLLFFMATDIVLSLFNSFLFLLRESLFLPIFIHALYNLTLISFIK
ncbi:MAG: CPBP family intramembrane metalloprotease [Patescibacteria group bacterium]|nr:CPBP family intramembrane metalloprotease [Patescibacteria group bacterium]